MEIRQAFPQETTESLSVQLYRWARRGMIIPLKRSYYCLPPTPQTNRFLIANLLVPNSYISLESALHIHRILPQTSQVITSAVPGLKRPISITNALGTFTYRTLKSHRRLHTEEHDGFLIATPEKALVDYIFLKEIKRPPELPLNMTPINKQKLIEAAWSFPLHVQIIIVQWINSRGKGTRRSRYQ